MYYNNDPAMARLRVIEEAIRLVEKDVADVEKTRANEGTNIARVKSTLSQVTSDIDLLFEEMDKLSGNEKVKKKRKAMVDRLRPVAERVDALIASLNMEQ